VLDLLSTPVLYHQKHATELLAETGIHCPPFESYVGNLVKYVKEARAARKPGARGWTIDDETVDPLA
jgi:hypothetical protein